MFLLLERTPTPADHIVSVGRFERFGGFSGGIAVALLATQFVLTSHGHANPASAAYATTLLEERWRWEWVTLLRIAGSLALLWFTAGLASRLRSAGREHAAPAAVAMAAGTVWAAVWLLSAVFNSVAITLAADYHDPVAARTAGALGLESVLVLTPGITIVLLAATALVAMRAPVFPRPFAYGTLFATGLRIVLALIDWYGPGKLSMGMMDFAFVWLVAAGTQLARPVTPVTG